MLAARGSKSADDCGMLAARGSKSADDCGRLAARGYRSIPCAAQDDTFPVSGEAGQPINHYIFAPLGSRIKRKRAALVDGKKTAKKNG
jgi:hypothetical protein